MRRGTVKILSAVVEGMDDGGDGTPYSFSSSPGPHGSDASMFGDRVESV